MLNKHLFGRLGKEKCKMRSLRRKGASGSGMEQSPVFKEIKEITHAKWDKEWRSQGKTPLS